MFVSQGIKIAPFPLPQDTPASDKPRADGADAGQYPFADEGITTSIRDATISGKPYPIKGWFVYSTNLMQALPKPSTRRSRPSRSSTCWWCATPCPARWPAGPT
jgi:hypothetical protein